MDTLAIRGHGSKLTTLLTLGLAPAILASCESLTGVAPKNTPRVEIELAVIVDEAFVEPLSDADAGLHAALKEAVRGKADLGLRFYPTPSDLYGESDRRPPYLMTVELDSLVVSFDREMIEEEGAEPRIDASVDTIGCSVSASVARRRENAPSLVVATSQASSQFSAETKPETLASGRGYVPKFEGPALKILEKDIVRAVEAAVDRALKAMRTPIDREFAPEPAPEPASKVSEV